jgi:hypothetical protein
VACSPRTPFQGTSVNKGKKKGRGLPRRRLRPYSVCISCVTDLS